VRIATTPALLVHMARSDSVDLTASRVVVRDGAPVAATLIARRGWTSRIAGMSLIPEARGQGVGSALMKHVIAEAKARHDRAMVLEVIEQNAPAVKLYERSGFHRVRRLVGFACSASGEARSTAAGDQMEEVDVRSVGAAVTAHGPIDLPWQLSGETIAQLTPPAIGYRLNGAWLAIANLTAPPIMVRALVAERGVAGHDQEIALLRAAMARHAGAEWRVTAIWPEEHAGVFLDAGFTRTPLTQWQMRRDLG